MFSKSAVMLRLLIGSTIGGYVPVLFGSSFLSFASVIGTTVGGIIGIYIAYKVTMY